MVDSIDEGNEISNGDVLLSSEIASGMLFGDATRVVTARGTEEGLVLRIDGKAEWLDILNDLEAFLGKRRRFLEGGQVSLEWLEKLPTKEQSKELEDILRTHYGIEVVVRRRKCANIRLAKDDKVCSQKKGGGGSTIPLFEESGAGTAAAPGGAEHREADHGTSSFSGVGTSHAYEAPFFALDGAEAGMQHGSAKFGAASVKGGGAPGYISPTSRKYLSQVSKLLGDDALYEEDANAKVVFGTLRSGQRIETPFSLVVIGDINPGADLIAGGDIIVLGNLRGTAHASAYDDDSFEHVIIALRMQPMQLRIGSVISRGSDEEVLGAEIARIENRRIIVEPFSPRDFLMRRGR